MIWTPRRLIGDPIGPIENGITYIVRPRMEPRNRPVSVARISSGSRQLLVGPRSAGVPRTDERPVLDARDIARVGPGQGSCWAAGPDRAA